MLKLTLAMGSAILFLSITFLVVDVSGVISAISRVPFGHGLAAILVIQMQIVLSALRWRFTSARLGHRIAASVAIREYYIGGILNQILPGGIAGDAARVYRNSNECSGGWRRAATAVVLERLSGQIAFFLLTCAGLSAWAVFLPETLPVRNSSLIWIAVACIAALATAGFWLRGWINERFRPFIPDFSAVFWRDGALVVQVGLSILIVGSYFATFMIASDAIGATLPLIAAVTVIPLCLLAMLVPLGIGGWGTREAAAAALWPVFGFTGTEGLASSLLYGVLTLGATALPGMLVLAGHMIGRFRCGR